MFYVASLLRFQWIYYSLEVLANEISTKTLKEKMLIKILETDGKVEKRHKKH